MATTITIDPVTRIEGHLDIEVSVEAVHGQQLVVDAHSSGTMFRGFEKILIGRDPRDATHLTQRVCGVCPVSHAMASSMTLEAAFGAVPPTNGRILRNLVLGSNFVQSHVLHFYHLAALDYIDTTGILDLAPWSPRYVTPDMIGGSLAQTLVQHYLDALAIRRKAHQMGAIFGGRLPCTSSFVPGGCTTRVEVEGIASFRDLLTEIRAFIDNVFVPDVQALGSLFPQYYNVGVGCRNLLAYGVFDQNASGSNKLLARGRYTDRQFRSVSTSEITEYVRYSRYTSGSGRRNPSAGVTEPQPDKLGAYSWLKAPRYSGKVHEVGPLARMWINGDYRRGISTMDRLVARALEAKKIADAMDLWLNQLVPGRASVATKLVPPSGSGIGLTEAPRGALGHWMQISDHKITRYQLVPPTNWNASPRDDSGRKGPIEQALMGTPVADPSQPIELIRVVHSFDPCLACAVHMVRPGAQAGKARILLQPSVA
jgi:hydrogenase large subunit